MSPDNYIGGEAQIKQNQSQGIDPDFTLMKGFPELTPKQLIKQRAEALRYEAAQLDELAACLPDRMMGYAESALILILKSAFNGGK
jgi:hypothetical protein